MTAGLQVFNNFGTLQLSDMFKSFAVTDKGTATMTSKYNNVFGQDFGYTIQLAVPNRTGFAPILAISSPNGFVVVLGVSALDTTNNVWKFWISTEYLATSGVTFDWYAFNPITGPVGNYGLQVWNAAGELTYDSSAKLLKIERKISGLLNDPGNAATNDFPSGPKYAVVDLQHSNNSSGQINTSGQPGGSYTEFSYSGMVKTLATGVEIANKEYMRTYTPSSLYTGAQARESRPFTYLVLDVTGY